MGETFLEMYAASCPERTEDAVEREPMRHAGSAQVCSTSRIFELCMSGGRRGERFTHLLQPRAAVASALVADFGISEAIRSLLFKPTV